MSGQSFFFFYNYRNKVLIIFNVSWNTTMDDRLNTIMTISKNYSKDNVIVLTFLNYDLINKEDTVNNIIVQYYYTATRIDF